MSNSDPIALEMFNPLSRHLTRSATPYGDIPDTALYDIPRYFFTSFSSSRLTFLLSQWDSVFRGCRDFPIAISRFITTLCTRQSRSPLPKLETERRFIGYHVLHYICQPHFDYTSISPTTLLPEVYQQNSGESV